MDDTVCDCSPPRGVQVLLLWILVKRFPGVSRWMTYPVVLWGFLQLPQFFRCPKYCNPWPQEVSVSRFSE